eukprot:jgi/Bigna1/72503/fgenesh1_pg.20_\
MSPLCAIAVTLLVSAFARPSASNGWVAHSRGSESQWKRVEALPTPRDTLSLVTLPDGTVLALGGTESGSNEISDAAERYFPGNNTWVAVPAMPSPRENFGAAYYDGKVFCVGGWGPTPSTPTSSVDVLDVATWTWSRGPPLPTTRAGTRAVGVKSGVLVVGGFTEPFSNTSYHKDTLLLSNASGNWKQTKTGLHHRRSNIGLTASLTTGKAYAVGGGEVHAGYNTSEAFDPSTEEWEPVGQLQVARSYEGLAPVTIDGEEYIYSIGGMTEVPLFDPTNSVERLSVSSGKWEEAESLPVARGGLAATTIVKGTSILVVGGEYSFVLSP